MEVDSRCCNSAERVEMRKAHFAEHARINFGIFGAPGDLTAEAVGAMADLMVDRLGVDYTSAAMLIASAADVRTGIAGHPPYTIRVAIPTSVLTL